MAPQVVAGLIGAAAVLISAGFTAFVAIWARRRQNTTDALISNLERKTQLAVSATSRDTELIVTALGHLGGGSQERAAGLATLHALESLTGIRWPDYSKVVGQLLYTQLLFVLTRGRNRWEAHEVANLTNMSTWLECDATLAPDDKMKLGLQQAMSTYIDDWGRGEPGGKRNEEAVNEFIHLIREKWPPSTSSSS